MQGRVTKSTLIFPSRLPGEYSGTEDDVPPMSAALVVDVEEELWVGYSS